MIQNILNAVEAALIVWLISECYNLHKLNKRADKLIETMKKEIEGSGVDV